jgi:hypothetical protein
MNQMNQKILNRKRRTIQIRSIVTVFAVLLSFSEMSAQEIPAFPGAEGHGMYTNGGRGGRVIKVTNLNDSGEGSFRAAVEAEGPRIVVFEVSGTIPLKSKLYITNNDITIAGQTAPGDGICIKNYCVYITASNVIIRYMRFRMGDEYKEVDDALGGQKSKNMIIDHCSMSWSIDECASFYANENFTMQWCLLTESLGVSFHKKGHGFGGIWGGYKATFHHNLLAHHTSRNPRFRGRKLTDILPSELVDIRNNVFYNWGNNSAYGSEGGGYYNMVNNYYKSGPGTDPKIKTRFLMVNAATAEYNWLETEGSHGQFYIDGNYVYGSDLISSDNWAGGVEWEDRISKENVKSDKEFEKGNIKTDDAQIAFQKVLKYAGASLFRDAVDKRAVHDTRTGTATIMDGGNGSTNGFIDTQKAVGGWPVLNSLPAPIDTDGDGMPDAWEIKNKLNPNDPTDANEDKNGDGYDNIENYINSLAVEHVDTRPIVNIIKPTNEYLFLNSKNQNIDVEIEANDYNGGQIANLALFWNNKKVEETEKGNITTNLKDLATGAHELIAKATDNTGNAWADTSIFYLGEKIVKLKIDDVKNGKVKLDPSGGVYTEGVTVKVTAVADEGYVFSKWANSPIRTESFSVVTEDKPYLFKPLFEQEVFDVSKYHQRIKVNFQSENYGAPEGYLTDSGGEFNKKINGYTYGWLEGYNSSAISNNKGVDSLLLNSSVSFRVGEDTFSWGMKLPKGKYRVKVITQVAEGDTTELPVIKVEGVKTKIVNKKGQFVEHEINEVELHNDKLNIASLYNCRICFIEIEWFDKV